MSLKSRKSIDSVGPDYHEEISITFRRESDGTYTKVVKTMRRDRKNSSIKEMKRVKPVETGPFEVVKKSDSYDEKMEYIGFDGEKNFIYLRMTDQNGSG